MEEPTTGSPLAEEEVQVGNQESQEGNSEVTDTVEDNQKPVGLTESSQKGKDSTSKILKTFEKKNLRIKSLEAKDKEKDEENLELHARLAKTDAAYRVELSNSKPEVAGKVAQKLGYEGIADFLSEVEEVEEEPTADSKPQKSSLDSIREAFIIANNPLLKNQDGSDSELNLFLGAAEKNLITQEPTISQDDYLRKMNTLRDEFQEKKKANQSLQEILAATQRKGEPKSGAAKLSEPEKKPIHDEKTLRFLKAMGKQV